MIVWDRRRVLWYSRALDESDFPDVVIRAIRPWFRGCRSALDIGAGCGALAVPLAQRMARVTALDPSVEMLRELRRRARRAGVSNIRCVLGAWGEVALQPHDLLIVANARPVIRDVRKFVELATPLTRRRITIVEHVETGREKFWLDELYPLLFNRSYPRRGDYLETYAALHGLGIFADLCVVSYRFDQPFRSLDEAVNFWANHLPRLGARQRDRLRAFLAEHLVRAGRRLLAPIPKTSAVLSWRP